MTPRRWLAGINWPIAAISGTVFVCGLLWQQSTLLGFGAALLCLMLRRVGVDENQQFAPRSRGRNDQYFNYRPGQENQRAKDESVAHDESYAHQHHERPLPAEPKSMDALVDELLANHRHALLLRPETKQHLTESQVLRAIRQLDEAMALVPGGKVLLGQLAEQANAADGVIEFDSKLAQRNRVEVEPAYLDRYCVTNEQFQQFVDGGGYEQLEFWHEEALPALLDFVDQSGTPAPRFWYEGQYQPGDARLPVVGVSWYEASAYAQWVGKRLPTDAEWTKAGAWPVEFAPGRIAQRRYPWGESFDVRRAHLYSSGNKQPMAVDDYPGGVSVGGIHQLIGNVWEWTATSLAELGDPTLHVSDSMMSIRGGAYDTYFENQATCHYQSGENPLARRHNIGFRLALPMRDLEPSMDLTPARVPQEEKEEGKATTDSTTESNDELAVTC